MIIMVLRIKYLNRLTIVNYMSANQPQEIEVWYVIPAIRKEFAKQLKFLGVSQVDISKILGVTKAAVTQYIKDKRAKNVVLPEKIILRIKKSSQNLKKNPKSITGEIQKIIHEIRISGLLCEYHKKYCNIEGKCSVCIE